MHHLHISKQLGTIAEAPKFTHCSPTIPNAISSMPIRSPTTHSAPNAIGPIRRRITDKSTLSLAGGECPCLDGIENQIIHTNKYHIDTMHTLINLKKKIGLPYMLERAGLDVQQGASIYHLIFNPINSFAIVALVVLNTTKMYIELELSV